MPDIPKWRIAITPNTEGWAQGGPPVICVFLAPLLQEGYMWKLRFGRPVALFVGICGILSAQPPAKVDFATDVLPILRQNCVSCHGPAQQSSGMRLDRKSVVISRRGVVPGSSDNSFLYHRISGNAFGMQMPPTGPLRAEQIQTIKTWIDQGADWPDSATKEVVQVQKHWAYIPPKRPAVPKVVNASWPKNAIDNFVLAHLEREKLAPSPEADRVTLLRRLSLDLTGLPPSVEDVDAFVKDQSHNAYEKQVEGGRPGLWKCWANSATECR